MGAQIVLAARLDLPAAAPLAAQLAAQGAGGQENEALAVDAGGVRHLGGLCLQVLLAAAQNRAGGLRLTAQSDDFGNALALFGVTPAMIENGGQG